MEALYQPLANDILVSIPERYIQKHAQGTKRLVIPAFDPTGALYETLISGNVSAYDLQFELEDDAHQTLVQQGTVLAVPRQLTKDLVLCGSLGTKPHTAADIQEFVQVGDTVHLDRYYIRDEYEDSPGIYRVPYSALICAINQPERLSDELFHWHEIAMLRPLAGYLLLNRVWADDVLIESEGSTLKVRKAGDLVIETNVAPLENEGVIAWMSTPLRGVSQAETLCVGLRVLITPGSAFLENICGVSYLCVRHPNIIAIVHEFPTKAEPQ